MCFFDMALSLYAPVVHVGPLNAGPLGGPPQALTGPSATRTRPGAGGGDGTGWGIGVSDRGDTSGLWTRGTTVDAPAQVIARGGKPGETRDKASTLVTRGVALSTSLRLILIHPLALGPVERRNRHGACTRSPWAPSRDVTAAVKSRVPNATRCRHGEVESAQRDAFARATLCARHGAHGARHGARCSERTMLGTALTARTRARRPQRRSRARASLCRRGPP